PAILGRRPRRAVAQFGRAPVSKTGGWGFESLLPCSTVTEETEAAVNRQTKRLMKRQGGEAPAPPERRRPTQAAPHRERTTPKQFVREVRAELRKVAWPTKTEVINSTIIVLVAVIVMTSLIFGMDYSFAKGVFYLFNK